jgi:hypothetical protein
MNKSIKHVPEVYDAPAGKCCAMSKPTTYGNGHPRPCQQLVKGTFWTCAPHRTAEAAAVELKASKGKELVKSDFGGPWMVDEKDHRRIRAWRNCERTKRKPGFAKSKAEESL